MWSETSNRLILKIISKRTITVRLKIIRSLINRCTYEEEGTTCKFLTCNLKTECEIFSVIFAKLNFKLYFIKIY